MIIKNLKQYTETMNVIEQLMKDNPDSDSPMGKNLGVLTTAAMKYEKKRGWSMGESIRRFGGIIDIYVDGDVYINNGKGKFYYVGFLVNEEVWPDSNIPVPNPAAESMCKALRKVLKEDDFD
jgi:hypothetical protein